MKIKRKILQPLLSFFQVFQELRKQITQAQLLMIASSLAYTTILSIIPVLAVSFAIFHAFGGMDKLYDTIEPLVLSNLAQGTSKEVIQVLHQFIDNTHAEVIGISGMVGLIFTSMSMLFSAEKAINQIWQVPASRGLFQRVSAYWLFITLGPLALSVAVGVATSFNLPLAKLFPNGTGMFLIAVGIFFFVYQYVPHTSVHWPFSLVSALFAAGGWNLARFGYGIYTSRVLPYHTVYGSLSAIPLTLLWIYIVWIIILAGAALTATLQKRFGPHLK